MKNLLKNVLLQTNSNIIMIIIIEGKFRINKQWEAEELISILAI